MEKQKHTPEPWHVGLDGESILAGDMGDPFVVTSSSHYDWMAADEEPSANAARIVACVNACAGIENPEAIPQAIAAMQALVDEHGAARYGTLEKRMRDWTVARDALAALRGE